MKLIYTLFFALLSLSSWSQTLETKLSKSYSKEEIAQFKAENSLPLYEYALTHACYLIDAPQGKDVSNFQTIQLSSNPDVPMVISKEPIVFTDFDLKILDRTQYFLVANTNKILVVKSKNILSLEMQTQQK
ncbi:MAG: hypothetical protein NWS92_02790 [Crocinitomicaceae bacterium]|jgi:hypothetical protein|nr:hypothetical protein [Crocinitomicaceae bacterium]MDP4739210.1 hypothetical protein [Crocinitomicaceae bacterium]MDP4799624.1 hypothetical protein [Crocinitomicaceae bacterium]MDP4806015.1 hypothetical protein [Crocinitomicaceae bacterium]MDP4955717.1 hypothetical protein [Crocinitomicaceae bacterium]